MTQAKNEEYMLALSDLFTRHPLPWEQHILQIKDRNGRDVIHLGGVGGREGNFLTSINSLIVTAANARLTPGQLGKAHAWATVLYSPSGEVIRCGQCNTEMFYGARPQFCGSCGAKFAGFDRAKDGQAAVGLGNIHALEQRMLRCFHCASELTPWNPQIGTGPARMETPFKWCPGCSSIMFKNLCALLGVSDQDAEAYLVARLPKS